MTNQPGAHAMRRRRNRAEYGTSFVSEVEVANAVANGRVMVEAVWALSND